MIVERDSESHSGREDLRSVPDRHSMSIDINIRFSGNRRAIEGCLRAARSKLKCASRHESETLKVGTLSAIGRMFDRGRSNLTASQMVVKCLGAGLGINRLMAYYGGRGAGYAAEPDFLSSAHEVAQRRRYLKS